ncbi:MAG: DUF5678 domain-containing protein [Nanoarchaeota archaeon]
MESNYEYYLDADLSSYLGEWVAIYENKIVSHGVDVRAVAKEAIVVCGNKKFLLSRVPSKETMIF